MNTEEFQDWISINNVAERTKKSFWQYIDNYREEEPDEFREVFSNIDLNSLNIIINKISLTISYRFDEPISFVSVCIALVYEGEEIGAYESLFTLSGNEMDDYLRMTN